MGNFVLSTNRIITIFYNPLWRKRIEEAKRKRSFNFFDNLASRDWGTCAVGETVKLNPELDIAVSNITKIPCSFNLYKAGFYFMEAVLKNNVEEAEKIFEEIRRYAYEERQAKYKRWMDQNDFNITEEDNKEPSLRN